LLVRHSTAVDTFAAPSDAHRWLTAAGRRRMEAVGVAVSEKTTLTHLFMSPYVRAVQTAEILAREVGYDQALLVHPHLASEFGTTAQALACLEGLPDSSVVALVTHMPKVRSMAVSLSGDDGVAEFRTGSVCAVVPGAGVQWRHDPT
jgi:phosphohistidine phosphatase SixA